MASIILSISKQYCDLLFDGKKQYEFRKSVPSRPVTSIFVYESKGCGKIIGELAVEEMITGIPEEVWLRTKDVSGIDEESFFKYYEGKKLAVAYSIGSYKRYEEPKPLSEFGVSRPPQNYIWFKN